MSQKITYSYTEFKNCPEATSISHSRERAKINHYLFCIVIFFMSVLFSFVESADRWIAICGVVVCPIWFVYLTIFYDKITDKLIKQALKNTQKKKYKTNIKESSKNISGKPRLFL